jgi:hypothetical protein
MKARRCKARLSQWEEIKLLHPHAPLTVAAFEDCRAYLSVECPQELDRALADFLAGRPVHGKAGIELPRTSPRAAVTQAVGGGEVRIAYSFPVKRPGKGSSTAYPASGAHSITTRRSTPCASRCSLWRARTPST